MFQFLPYRIGFGMRKAEGVLQLVLPWFKLG